MFIEVTDHLRCPEDHEESFLVLLPSRMEGRVVLEGDLGCPACGRTIALTGGLTDWGDAEPAPAAGVMTADAAEALLGLSGPGGYVALVGSAGGLSAELAGRLRGIHLIAVNPPRGTEPDAPATVLRAPRLPIKRASMRGVVLGAGLSPEWTAAAAAAVLPGLRVVGEGEPPPDGGPLEVIAEAGGVWVARRRG